MKLSERLRVGLPDTLALAVSGRATVADIVVSENDGVAVSVRWTTVDVCVAVAVRVSAKEAVPVGEWGKGDTADAYANTKRGMMQID